MMPRLVIVVAALILCCLLLAGCGSGSAATAPRETAIVEEAVLAQIPADTLTLPNHASSIKFAVIGDSGRGTPEQIAIARQMAAFRERFDYSFVLMAGDNIYEGKATPEDYRLKFEEPYKKLLDDGVRFFAVLGNHDDPDQVNYRPFNMDGHRYYTFTPPGDLIAKLDTGVRFFALDSMRLDNGQLEWLERELQRSKAEWKVVLMHYPIYTSGRYSLRARRQRWALESYLVNGGVDVAFSGHEHIYQRSQLQGGILHFISGGAGSLRAGDATPSSAVARSYDQDYHFMLVEIADDRLSFQAINREGRTIDAGSLRKPPRAASAASAPATPNADTLVRR